jgi:endonuclease/exonuclease/phosphatase family metal-dependent hydrolase
VIAAEICAPGGRFWAVSAHFESESTPTLRATQAKMTVAGLTALTGAAPVVLGGDFNVKALPRDDIGDRAILDAPGASEPMFDVFAEAGFDWRSANIPGVTTRRHPWQTPLPGIKIDWLFVRGAVGRNAWIAPALGEDGTVFSDHDPIGAEFTI